MALIAITTEAKLVMIVAGMGTSARDRADTNATGIQHIIFETDITKIFLERVPLLLSDICLLIPVTVLLTFKL